jgi:hypothetical protein
LDPGDGSTVADKFKARLTAGGDMQWPGHDYDNTWAPVVKHSTLRTLIAYALTHGYDITQLDFDGAYLNGTIDSDIYMEQPEVPGMDLKIGRDGRKMLCHLRKSLYGLKQAGRIWYQTLKTWLIGQGFTCLKTDQCVFTKHTGNKWLVCWVYVDDMGVFGDSALKEKFITDLGNQFDIFDKGSLQYYLGINIQKHGASVTLDQKKYIKEILQEFDLTDQHPVVTPMHSDPPPRCTWVERRALETMGFGRPGYEVGFGRG